PRPRAIPMDSYLYATIRGLRATGVDRHPMRALCRSRGNHADGPVWLSADRVHLPRGVTDPRPKTSGSTPRSRALTAPAIPPAGGRPLCRRSSISSFSSHLWRLTVDVSCLVRAVLVDSHIVDSSGK